MRNRRRSRSRGSVVCMCVYVCRIRRERRAKLSTVSTVDNRLADGRGLSRATDRSRIPSSLAPSLARSPSLARTSRPIPSSRVALPHSATLACRLAPCAPSFLHSFLYTALLFSLALSRSLSISLSLGSLGRLRDISPRSVRGHDGRGTHEVGKHGNHGPKRRT